MSAGSDLDHLPEVDSDELLPDRQVAHQVLDDGDDDEYTPENGDLRSIFPPGKSSQVDNLDRAFLSSSPAVARDRTVPLLKDDLFAQEPTYLTRPNRWYGADSTWLSWTEEDRLVAKSLDRVRSQDLSLHLYNAHVLNSDAKQSRDARRRRIKGKMLVSSEEDPVESEAEKLVPPSGWTAWPLPAHQIPRESLIPDTKPTVVYRMQDDPRPSADLEECLIATTTRFARERWNTRAWMPVFPQKRQWGIKVEEGEEIEQDVNMGELSPEASSEDDNIVETVTSGSDSASDNGGDQVYTSQAYGLALDDEDEKSAMGQQGRHVDSLGDQQPVPVADDELARELLLPSTRHMLSKLDDLLMGLHRARQSYASTSYRRRQARTSGRDESVASDSESEISLASSSNRKRKRTGTASVASSTSAQSEPREFEDTEKGRMRRIKLNTRNWSDVIGMAALTGWDAAVVERASQRCASLFDENILFRTFHEGNAKVRQASYFTEHEALDDEESFEPDTQEDSLTAMVRTSQACNECHALKEKCEAPDDAEGHSDCQRCAKLGLQCSGITVKVYDDIGRSCPYQSCERHNIPFSKSWHLQRHLDTVHQNDALRNQPDDPPTVTANIEQPVHAKIVCPVLTCPRHKQPFTRGTRLYEHVQKMHPEVDVHEVKRLEVTRRGEKRGRWKGDKRSELGRANRSRSKSKGPRHGSDG